MTEYVIPHPMGISWERWSAEMVGNNPTLTNHVWPELDFKKFGARMTLVEPRTPRPEFYKDWQSWATSLKRALQS